MCLNTWTFKPINVDKIYCKKCVLRWTWDAHHISKDNPEKYENCIDVTINGSANVVKAAQSEPSSKPSDSGVILPPSLKTESKSSADAFKPAEPIIRPNDQQMPASNSAYQQPPLVSSGNSNDCKCDLSTEGPIYTQCTPDGNYCTCFSGAWSSLGKLKSNCAPGTSCKQSGSQITCG
jgi:hypothetical protein